MSSSLICRHFRGSLHPARCVLWWAVLPMPRLPLLPLLPLLLASLASCQTVENPLEGGRPISPVDPGAGETDAPEGEGTSPCSGKAGTFSDQAFDSGGETRHYWLH